MYIYIYIYIYIHIHIYIYACPSRYADIAAELSMLAAPGKVDIRLPGKGNGARPVRQIIVMIKWIRTSRLSIKNSLSLCACPSRYIAAELSMLAAPGE